MKTRSTWSSHDTPVFIHQKGVVNAFELIWTNDSKRSWIVSNTLDQSLSYRDCPLLERNRERCMKEALALWRERMISLKHATREGLSEMVEHDLLVIAISFVRQWTTSTLRLDRRETCRRINMRARCTYDSNLDVDEILPRKGEMPALRETSAHSSLQLSLKLD